MDTHSKTMVVQLRTGVLNQRGIGTPLEVPGCVKINPSLENEIGLISYVKIPGVYTNRLLSVSQKLWEYTRTPYLSFSRIGVNWGWVCSTPVPTGGALSHRRRFGACTRCRIATHHMIPLFRAMSRYMAALKGFTPKSSASFPRTVCGCSVSCVFELQGTTWYSLSRRSQGRASKKEIAPFVCHSHQSAYDVVSRTTNNGEST